MKRNQLKEKEVGRRWVASKALEEAGTDAPASVEATDSASKKYFLCLSQQGFCFVF